MPIYEPSHCTRPLARHIEFKRRARIWFWWLFTCEKSLSLPSIHPYFIPLSLSLSLSPPTSFLFHKMMIKELHQQELELFLRQEVRDKEVKTRGLIDHPELSLGPSRCDLLLSLSPTSKKRKYCWDQSSNEPMIQTSVELQVEGSLPLDWEQCLDLQSGRMYYLNRKTSKRSWKWPRDQKLDLELNISTPSSSTTTTDEARTSFEISMEAKNQSSSTSSSGCSNMVAVACMKCHLLVMICRSSPSCPNCKYVHSLLPPTQQQTLLPRNTFKPFNTLSLLN